MGRPPNSATPTQRKEKTNAGPVVSDSKMHRDASVYVCVCVCMCTFTCMCVCVRVKALLNATSCAVSCNPPMLKLRLKFISAMY